MSRTVVLTFDYELFFLGGCGRAWRDAVDGPPVGTLPKSQGATTNTRVRSSTVTAPPSPGLQSGHTSMKEHPGVLCSPLASPTIMAITTLAS